MNKNKKHQKYNKQVFIADSMSAKPVLNNTPPPLLFYGFGAVVLVLAYLFLQASGALERVAVMANGTSNLLAIFLVGLFAGGLSCMAVQGGLLAATLAQREEEKLLKSERNSNVLALLSFLIAKLIAYTILGFLLGALGSVFRLSLTAQVFIQIAISIFMIGTALAILDVHPIFRYFIIQPPKFLTRLVRKQSKSKDIFAPAILGAFTVFIPCGVTQGMMALSIASGNAFMGGAILAAFVLGTSPIFFTLGYLATQLGETLKSRFMKVASFLIILLAAFNIYNALALAGITIQISTPTQSSKIPMSASNLNTNLTITAQGYTPNTLTIKSSSHVTIHITNTTGAGCQQGFTIPSLGIQKIIPLGKSEDITFNAPNKPGKIPFMCSMGMYRGVITVI